LGLAEAASLFKNTTNNGGKIYYPRVSLQWIVKSTTISYAGQRFSFVDDLAYLNDTVAQEFHVELLTNKTYTM